MAVHNFDAALAFVWAPGRDSPRDKYHVTPGDPGLGTNGGVTAATWSTAVNSGIVKGVLADASNEQLRTVLEVMFWAPACDKLPAGLDLLLFNGCMLTGRFAWLFQSCLGLVDADDVDGWIGPQSLALARSRDPETFIDATCGSHYLYLSGLPTWKRFGGGWTTRIKDVQIAARELADAAPIA